MKRAKIDGVTLHDLRRSFGQALADSGENFPIIGTALGHQPGSEATRVYTPAVPKPVRVAVEKVSEELAGIAGPKVLRKLLGA
jgi:integrase